MLHKIFLASDPENFKKTTKQDIYIYICMYIYYFVEGGVAVALDDALALMMFSGALVWTLHFSFI